MKDIQHYKDLIAVEHGYEDWDDVLIDYKTGEIDRNTAKELENEWAKRYAEDMCKEQRDICADEVFMISADVTDLRISVRNAKLATDN